jgi:hypothetical protein
MSYDRRSSIDRSWNRKVTCPLCNFGATVKVTKTDNLVLRCDTCHALIFANDTLSQKRLGLLPDYVSPRHHNVNNNLSRRNGYNI